MVLLATFIKKTKLYEERGESNGLVHKCEFEHIRKILCILITVFVMINSFLAEAEGMTEDLTKAEFAALYNNILKFSSRKPTISAVHNKGIVLKHDPLVAAFFSSKT